MASPGDSIRSVITAAWVNRVNAMLQGNKLTGVGPVVVSPGKNGAQIVMPRAKVPVSTLQGVLTGGSAPTVSDGETIIDLYAFNAYSIQGAAFVLAAGTATVSVEIDGTPISWLDSIAVTTSILYIPIANPAPDLTNLVGVGSELSIVIAGASSATGLSFSLNVPY